MSIVRAAVPQDIAELVRLRELFMNEMSVSWGPVPAGNGWRAACAEALAVQLAGDSMRVVVMDGETGLASCGMGVVDQRLYRSLGFDDHPDPMLSRSIIGQ